MLVYYYHVTTYLTFVSCFACQNISTVKQLLQCYYVSIWTIVCHFVRILCVRREHQPLIHGIKILSNKNCILFNLYLREMLLWWNYLTIISHSTLWFLLLDYTSVPFFSLLSVRGLILTCNILITFSIIDPKYSSVSSIYHLHGQLKMTCIMLIKQYYKSFIKTVDLYARLIRHSK